ncbi:TetR/AcrR family transcriptional regulator [Fictibacillus sp. WQ 8-8]|uniref:TetR/AcrR family transcriptional regulator n=1 Tax=Fictibacillus sp. WQ 8-8 TaxID=2938788 RepID=UPI00210EE663|nr:TetR/AcrR family transcriptional regulator [Fictibacillus sp. WQ 8-8]MCQ6268619.1 TetR/AcrR family transcriptional regulator [Fictibacillus sp. WQ 8-8]
MPQFSQTEKEKINEQLIVIAKQLFSSKGIKKTSLEDLTSVVGIAKSSFYVFFESKEALYLELLDQEGPGIEERVWEAVNQKSSIEDKIKTYLHEMTRELDDNPLMKRLQTHPDELQSIARKVTPEFLQKKTERNVLPLLHFINEQKEAGELIDKDSEVILRLMRAAMTISLHKKDIGIDLYPKIQDMMFEAVSSYITKRKPQEE